MVFCQAAIRAISRRNTRFVTFIRERRFFKLVSAGHTTTIFYTTDDELKALETNEVAEEEIDYFLACHALECVSSDGSDSS